MKDVALWDGTGELLKQQERLLELSQIGSHPVALCPDLDSFGFAYKDVPLSICLWGGFTQTLLGVRSYA